jgi:diphthamide biosynthesis methyltransferase
MTPEIAVDVLRRSAIKVASECSDSEAIDEWKIILCSDMGTDSQQIRYGNLEQLSKITEGRMHCLAIPAMSLHEIEELALKRWSI